jgi:hypothetical protein
MVAGLRGLRVPEGVIEVEVTEATELDDKLAVELEEGDDRLLDEVLWENELEPVRLLVVVEEELELMDEVVKMLDEDVRLWEDDEVVVP